MYTTSISQKRLQIIKLANPLVALQKQLNIPKLILLSAICLWGFSIHSRADLVAPIEAISKIDPTAAVVLNDENGNRLLSFNAEKSMVPASIIKIVLAQASLELLGESFRFKTEFYLEPNQALTIKGFGDPFLISEEIQIIAENLRSKSLDSIYQINLDASSFVDNITIPGTSNSLNPYDALNGALVVNFNTIFVGKKPEGTVYSAEDPTPLTPLAVEKARGFKPGQEERVNLTTSPRESLIYVGQLFSAILELNGIKVIEKNINRSKTSKTGNLLYQHYSTVSLDSILKGLMKYSNNFIANQIFLVIGAEKMTYPATLEKSRKVFKDYIEKKWGFLNGDFIMDEASGISRYNRLNADQMMMIMEDFRVNSDLLSEKNNIKIKSGTLTGVYNYAGFINTKNGLRPFVIMTENSRNNRDKILKILKNID